MGCHGETDGEKYHAGVHRMTAYTINSYNFDDLRGMDLGFLPSVWSLVEDIGALKIENPSRSLITAE